MAQLSAEFKALGASERELYDDMADISDKYTKKAMRHSGDSVALGRMQLAGSGARRSARGISKATP